MKICCLINAKFKFVQKMEMYCGVGHEDVEHGTKLCVVDGWVQEQELHVITFSLTLHCFGIF
jgi:hypothetical protein